MNSADPAPKGDVPRRPYEPPAIEETSEFETLALSCTGLANEISCDPYATGGTIQNS